MKTILDHLLWFINKFSGVILFLGYYSIFYDLL